MSFEHACFISYSNGNNRIVTEYIKQLQDALESQLEMYFKKSQFNKSHDEHFHFIDKDRIHGDTVVDATIANAIFNSVCMLVAYWPAYEVSDYCLRELQGMKQIEVMRREHCNYPDNTECLIIPVFFRPNSTTIFDTKGIDVSRYFLATGNLSLMDEFWAEIDKVCGKIKKHFDGLTKNDAKLKKLFKQRKQFALPNSPLPPQNKKRHVLMSRSGK